MQLINFADAIPKPHRFENFKSRIFLEHGKQQSLGAGANKQSFARVCIVLLRCCFMFAFNRLSKSRKRFKQLYSQFFKALARPVSHLLIQVRESSHETRLLPSERVVTCFLSGTVSIKRESSKK